MISQDTEVPQQATHYINQNGVITFFIITNKHDVIYEWGFFLNRTEELWSITTGVNFDLVTYAKPIPEINCTFDDSYTIKDYLEGA